MKNLGLAFLLAMAALASDGTIWIENVELKIGMEKKEVLALLGQIGDLRKTEFANETPAEQWIVLRKNTDKTIADVYFERGRLHQATQHLKVSRSEDTVEVFRDVWEAMHAEIPTSSSGGPLFGRGVAGIMMTESGGIHGKQYSLEIHFVDTDRTLELLLTDAPKRGSSELWIGKRVTGDRAN